jgi:hypothetical protein
MEMIRSSETSVHTRTTRRYIPLEDNNQAHNDVNSSDFRTRSSGLFTAIINQALWFLQAVTDSW